MRTRVPYVPLLALVSLACASAAPRADRPAALAGWTLLGERTVNHGVERDEIVVGAGASTFERLRLAVRDRPVTFHGVEVHYANGTRQDVALRHRIPMGGETRAIDLTGADRRIARVVFRYETAHTRDTRDRRATVALYGWR